MATRAFIGFKPSKKSDRILAIYCHNDGYPENIAPILINHYTTPEQVKALIGLGNLSVLGKFIGEKHEFQHPSYKDLSDPEAYWKMIEERSWCKAYARDRGDKDCEAAECNNLTSFAAVAKEMNCDYIYLFQRNEGGWKWMHAQANLANNMKPLAST